MNGLPHWYDSWKLASPEDDIHINYEEIMQEKEAELIKLDDEIIEMKTEIERLELAREEVLTAFKDEITAIMEPYKTHVTALTKQSVDWEMRFIQLKDDFDNIMRIIDSLRVKK